MVMEEENDSDGWLRIDEWMVTYPANSQIEEAGPSRAYATPFVVDCAFNRIWTSGHICIEPGETRQGEKRGM